MKFHYVYRITNKKLIIHYYGTRSCKNIHPKEDLGFKYFSSSTDKDFLLNQEENPQDYKYKVLKIFRTRKEAISLEIFLHTKFDVKNNPNFYNKSNQTSTGFDTTGKVNINGSLINKKDFDSDIHNFHSKGKVSVKDKNGNTLQTDINDPEYLNGNLISVSTGYVNAINPITNKHIKVTIDEYYKNNYICNNTNKSPVKDKNGNTYLINKNDPRIKSGELVHTSTNTVMALNINTNKYIHVSKEIFDKNEHLVGVNKFKFNNHNNPNAKIIYIYNSNDKLMYKCHGNFSKICKKNNLPMYQLTLSYKNNTKIYQTKRSKSYAKRYNYEKYISWYAKILC